MKNKGKAKKGAKAVKVTADVQCQQIVDQMMQQCDDGAAWASLGPLECVTKLHELALSLCETQESLTPLPTEAPGGAGKDMWDAFWAWADAPAPHPPPLATAAASSSVKDASTSPMRDSVAIGWIDAAHGHGCSAARALEAGEVVMRVPTGLMLHTSSAAVDSGSSGGGGASACCNPIPALAQEDGLLRATPTLALALTLAYERRKGPSSFFAPYVALLPASFDVPLFWNPTELKLLHDAAPNVFTKVANGWRMSCKQYCYLFQLGLRDPSAFGAQGLVSFALFRWALGATVTRQNEVPLHPPTKQLQTAAAAVPSLVLALIPVWDMCNHAADSGKHTETYFNAGASSSSSSSSSSCSGALECRTLRPFAKGEEVPIFYGARPNLQLFLYSGFVPLPRPPQALSVRGGKDGEEDGEQDEIPSASGGGSEGVGTDRVADGPTAQAAEAVLNPHDRLSEPLWLSLSASLLPSSSPVNDSDGAADDEEEKKAAAAKLVKTRAVLCRALSLPVVKTESGSVFLEFQPLLSAATVAAAAAAASSTATTAPPGVVDTGVVSSAGERRSGGGGSDIGGGLLSTAKKQAVGREEAERVRLGLCLLACTGGLEQTTDWVRRVLATKTARDQAAAPPQSTDLLYQTRPPPPPPSSSSSSSSPLRDDHGSGVPMEWEEAAASLLFTTCHARVKATKAALRSLEDAGRDVGAYVIEKGEGEGEESTTKVEASSCSSSSNRPTELAGEEGADKNGKGKSGEAKLSSPKERSEFVASENESATVRRKLLIQALMEGEVCLLGFAASQAAGFLVGVV